MDTCNILKRSFLLLALVIGGFDSPVWAGGPRLVSDTGEPYGWDPSQPVLFNADQGPLGVLDNATVLDLVQQAFEVWKSVPTATITFANGGSLPLDVDTPEELFMSIDQRDSLSPIIFDTDGSLTDAVFGPGSSTSILGFAGAEFVTLEAPFFITEGRAIFNGRAINGDFDDGIEISTERLLGLFVHEFGHFIGLGHTQVNGFSTTSYGGPLPTSMTATMFPFLLGGEATLHTDDVVAVSTLYPTSTFFSSTGAIIGDILLPDRITPFTGANVISRNIDNPHADAVSYVSGARFISRVFKTTTLTELQGRFQLFGLTPGASYTVEVEQIDPAFTGRSLVGSVDPPPVLPGPPEFWDAAESAMDDPAASTPIVVTAGSPVTGVDIILNAYGFGLRLKTDYDVGYRPFSVFSTDLDGDGDNDLAVANYGSRNVSVLLNNGDGTFADKVDYDVGYRPFSVFSTDLDGDGDNDLAVANNGNRNVSVLLNNGDGTFADKVDYDVGYGPYSVFSADVDGDGDNDLAVANNGSRNVSVLLNNGDGTFADKVDYDVGYRPGSVFSADVDGDGDNDLITANWFSDNVSVLLNNGDGTFADKVDYDVGYGPYSVFSADVDGDGDNDLITANWFSGNVSVLLNNGNGTFAGKMDYVAGTNPFSVFSADLDGDGDNDLAVANSGSDNVSVLLNNGNGTFADKVDYGVWDGPASVFIADLDGDGDNDLAVANYGSDNVSVLLHFSRPYPPIVTSTDPDSGVELVLTPVKITGSNFQRGATVTFGDSRAINVVVVATNTITAKTPAHPAGTVDMIVTNPDGMTGTLSGGFTFLSHPVVTSVNPASGPELGGTPVTIAGGNFKIGTTVTFSDIAATDIVVFTSIITAVTPTHPAGTVDVIVTNPDGQADTLENGFTFVPALFGLPTDYTVGNEPFSVFTADLDGDGDNDLAVANGLSFEVSILLNNGDGKFAGKVDYNIGNQPFSIFSADVDGDGDNDLITANWFSDNVSVLLNNGNGTFAGKMDYCWY